MTYLTVDQSIPDISIVDVESGMQSCTLKPSLTKSPPSSRKENKLQSNDRRETEERETSKTLAEIM